MCSLDYGAVVARVPLTNAIVAAEVQARRQLRRAIIRVVGQIEQQPIALRLVIARIRPARALNLPLVIPLVQVMQAVPVVKQPGQVIKVLALNASAGLITDQRRDIDRQRTRSLQGMPKRRRQGDGRLTVAAHIGQPIDADKLIIIGGWHSVEVGQQRGVPGPPAVQDDMRESLRQQIVQRGVERFRLARGQTGDGLVLSPMAQQQVAVYALDGARLFAVGESHGGRIIRQRLRVEIPGRGHAILRQVDQLDVALPIQPVQVSDFVVFQRRALQRRIVLASQQQHGEQGNGGALTLRSRAQQGSQPIAGQYRQGQQQSSLIIAGAAKAPKTAGSQSRKLCSGSAI